MPSWVEDFKFPIWVEKGLEDSQSDLCWFYRERRLWMLTFKHPNVAELSGQVDNDVISPHRNFKIPILWQVRGKEKIGQPETVD
ncbi:hypothetical protein AAC387_Pa06g2018 [Persea americana]